MKIKKLMWSSFTLQMIALIIILSLVLTSKTIPDLLLGIFMISMLICIISFFFVQIQDSDKNDKLNNDFKKNMIRVFLLLLPMVALLMFIQFIGK